MYAIHVKKTAGALATYGYEYGALALCTTAVSVFLFTLLNHCHDNLFLYQTERALSFWETGEDLSTKTDEKGKRKVASSFGESEWGSKARAWSQATKRLDFEQWRVIGSKATIFGHLYPQDEPNGEDNDDVDPRAVLEL